MLEAALRSHVERRTIEIEHATTSAGVAGGRSVPSARAYAGLVLPRLERIAREQLAPIEQGGEAVAQALAGGGRVWVTQTSHYLHQEATHRAGGLIAVHALESPDDVAAGDVVLFGITAGAAAEVVDLALDLQRRGARVIAISQLDFERHPDLPATHPSGRRLSDVADVHVDIGGPYGDGELELGETGIRVLPSSGVSSLLVLWMVLADAVGRLQAQGIVPLAYESNLLPGARSRNEAREGRYAATGRGVDAPGVAGRAP
jgi:uncharacterized phosphosugar-binding protein